MTVLVRQSGRVIPIERRSLSAPGRSRPKPDSVEILRTIAADLRNMPRDCTVDRAELLLWHSRMARQIEAIALDGFVAEPIRTAQIIRQPFAARPAVDARAVAESVFGSSTPGLRSSTVQSRRGKAVKVEVRRKRQRVAGQITLFPDLDEVPS